MLVCSISLRPRRRIIAADIVEAAAALDDPGSGTIFVTLTDDPGDALDRLDAFLGQRVVEAANAVAVVDALTKYPAFVVEEISAAIAAQDASLNVPVVLVARQSMVGTVFVNADGTARQANAYGVMVNL
jgi:hypothetical protein